MRVTAPAFACPILRPFTAAGEHRLGVSVASAWTLDGAPLPASELWRRFARAAGEDTALDHGIPKSESEWLLVGCAHAPGPITHLAVGVETAAGRKTLHVVGDRTWRRGEPTPPAPFESMPLDRARAFGGPGFADNPHGRGYVSGDPEGAPLPNVEAPGQMVGAPGDRPAPAGFGPLPFDAPAKLRGLGTYDAAWLERDAPGFARDIDWRVHNLALEDQRREAPWRPGERLVLHHLVAGAPRVEVALPSAVARAFVYGPGHAAARTPDAPALEEVPLAPRTVWLAPDEDLVVVIATGSRPLPTMRPGELAGLVVALDAPGAERPVAHFEGALAARLASGADGALAMLEDAPLMPVGLSFPSLTEQAEDLTLPSHIGAVEASLEAARRARRAEAIAQLEAAGFEGGEDLFPEPATAAPDERPLAEQVREALADAEAQRASVEAARVASRAQAEADLSAAGFDAAFLDQSPPPGPPPVLAGQQLGQLEATAREAREAGAPMPALEAQLADPEYRALLAEQERRGREAYRLTAHLADGEVGPPANDWQGALREEVARAAQAGESLAERDLTGADLNELDLRGADLRGAWLEGAELQRANLTGARLDGAVLSRADLSEARLEGACLSGANLGRARLLWTRLGGCDLEEAILAHADLRAAVFERCDLRAADLSDAVLQETSFVGCDLRRLTLMHRSLGGARFDGCRLGESNLVEVDLRGASFSTCDLFAVAFVTCRGDDVDFGGSSLENARFVAGCALPRANFAGVCLSRACLRSADLEGARFDGADLRAADLSEARCAGVSLYRADARGLLATDAALSGANLRGANLMNAVLTGADLRGADLGGSNLFAADLALVHVDAATSLSGALTNRARHRPVRPVVAGVAS